MTEQKHFPWTGGLPTGPDVALLQEHWTDLKIGDRITYDDVAAVLGFDRMSKRWTSVTAAWRKRELEKGNVIECESGTAFFVADTKQIFSMTHGTFERIGKVTHKQMRRLSTVRPENEIEKNTVQHQGNLLSVMRREAKKNRMNILPPADPKEPVRIEPPKKPPKVGGSEQE